MERARAKAGVVAMEMERARARAGVVARAMERARARVVARVVARARVYSQKGFQNYRMCLPLLAMAILFEVNLSEMEW